jgi:hypothetical protein
LILVIGGTFTSKRRQLPAISMTRLLRFADPHRAYVTTTTVRGESVPPGSAAIGCPQAAGKRRFRPPGNVIDRRPKGQHRDRHACHVHGQPGTMIHRAPSVAPQESWGVD